MENKKEAGMRMDLMTASSIEINASSEEVWEALTNPEKIKVYLYGTETITDWEIGSTIQFIGEYGGQKYHDKGNVLNKLEPNMLKYNYWTGMSGLEDHPDNYSVVIYTIEELEANKVLFTWTQIGFTGEDKQAHTETGLKGMLEQIKQVAEA